MIRIKVLDNKYAIPTVMKELPIGKFQEISAVETEQEFKKITEYITILTGLDYNIIKNLDVEDVRSLMNKFDFNVDKETPIIPAVEIDNIIYKFDSNLDNMQFGMFIDLMELTKDEDIIIDNLHLIMAILYRPIIKQKLYDRMFKRKLVIEPYIIETVKERAELFKNKMMMDKILGAMFFFINLKMNYLEDIEDYLTPIVQDMKKMAK